MRKITTLFSSVFLNMWLQLSTLAYSLLTLFFLSREYWGAYNKIVISVSFFIVVCSWGSREFLTTSRKSDFSAAVFENMNARVVLLLMCCVAIFFLFPVHRIFAVTFLCLRFLNSGTELIIYKERKYKRVLLFEFLILALFTGALFLWHENIRENFSYFLLLFLGVEALRAIAYFYSVESRFHVTLLKLGTVADELKKSFPFFLNAIFGFYGSRIDSLIAVFYFSDAQMSSFQIAFNFVFLFQALANYIFFTYSYHFYRLSRAVKQRIIRNYVLIGALVSLGFLLLIGILFRFVYHIQLDYQIYACLVLFVFLTFVHQPFIYIIYQHKRTISISLISLSSIALFIVSIFVLGLIPGQNIFNLFVYASLLSQIFRSTAFVIMGKNKLKNATDQ